MSKLSWHYLEVTIDPSREPSLSQVNKVAWYLICLVFMSKNNHLIGVWSNVKKYLFPSSIIYQSAVKIIPFHVRQVYLICFQQSTSRLPKVSTCSVESCHAEHCPLVSFPHVILADHQLDAVPSLRLVQPLVGVDRYLCTQRLRHH